MMNYNNINNNAIYNSELLKTALDMGYNNFTDDIYDKINNDIYNRAKQTKNLLSFDPLYSSHMKNITHLSLVIFGLIMVFGTYTCFLIHFDCTPDRRLIVI